MSVFFEMSKEKIFARTWQFAGRVADLATLTPITVFDEPLLLSKSTEGLQCLSNVCTHRGKILVDEPCDASLIRCGYHGRRSRWTVSSCRCRSSRESRISQVRRMT